MEGILTVGLPDDRAAAQAALRHAMEQAQAYLAEARAARPAGQDDADWPAAPPRERPALRGVGGRAPTERT